MKKIAIYAEGGGDSPQQKSDLRNGFDLLLKTQKQAARDKKLGWKLVFSGGRNQTYEAFINAVRYADDQTLCVLLVDSEDELPAELPKSSKEKPTPDQVKRTNANHRKAHLINRDGWDLTEIPSEQIHLMVRCMETWIVSDPEELQSYYQQGFLAKSLPTRLNLEDEPKESVYEKLQKATKGTSKGAYDKIKHASKLLGLIAPKKVADRCPRFATFVSWLDDQIRRA